MIRASVPFAQAERVGRRVGYTIADARLRKLLHQARQLADDNCEHLATCSRIGPDRI